MTRLFDGFVSRPPNEMCRTSRAVPNMGFQAEQAEKACSAVMWTSFAVE